MGNRAFITTEEKELGVYLHWNGGRDSVEAFLKYCELRRFRSPETDGYGWARLCQVIGNWFESGLSVGVETYTTDKAMVNMASDNGIYIIKNWQIVDRIFPYKVFQEQTGYDLIKMLGDIDASQPPNQRLWPDGNVTLERTDSQDSPPVL